MSPTRGVMHESGSCDVGKSGRRGRFRLTIRSQPTAAIARRVPNLVCRVGGSPWASARGTEPCCASLRSSAMRTGVRRAAEDQDMDRSTGSNARTFSGFCHRNSSISVGPNVGQWVQTLAVALGLPPTFCEDLAPGRGGGARPHQGDPGGGRAHSRGPSRLSPRRSCVPREHPASPGRATQHPRRDRAPANPRRGARQDVKCSPPSQGSSAG